MYTPEHAAEVLLGLREDPAELVQGHNKMMRTPFLLRAVGEFRNEEFVFVHLLPRTGREKPHCSLVVQEVDGLLDEVRLLLHEVRVVRKNTRVFLHWFL